MTHCSDDTWCCGDKNNSDCCDKGFGFKLASSIAPYLQATGSSAANITATVTVTSTPTLDPQGSATVSSQSGAIGLGVALGVVLLADAAVINLCLFRRQKWRNNGGVLWNVGPGGANIAQHKGHYELPQGLIINEAPEREVSQQAVELKGGGRI
jgi:hypothetical protein